MSTPKRRSSIVAASVLLLAAMFSVSAVQSRVQRASFDRERREADGWTTRVSDSMLTLSWNRYAAELRDAQGLELIVSEGGGSGRRISRQPLRNAVGTIVIPFGTDPFLAEIAVRGGVRDGQIVPLFQTAGTKLATGTPAQAPETAAPALTAWKVEVPMVWADGEKAAVASTAEVVMPKVSGTLSRAANLDMSIKVAADGRVSSVATSLAGRQQPDSKLRRAAEDALLQWKFEPVTDGGYRDARVRFSFRRSGVTLIVPKA